MLRIEGTDVTARAFFGKEGSHSPQSCGEGRDARVAHRVKTQRRSQQHQSCNGTNQRQVQRQQSAHRAAHHHARAGGRQCIKGRDNVAEPLRPTQLVEQRWIAAVSAEQGARA